jgi:hypothetical protein
MFSILKVKRSQNLQDQPKILKELLEQQINELKPNNKSTNSNQTFPKINYV